MPKDQSWFDFMRMLHIHPTHNKLFVCQYIGDCGDFPLEKKVNLFIYVIIKDKRHDVSMLTLMLIFVKE